MQSIVQILFNIHFYSIFNNILIDEQLTNRQNKPTVRFGVGSLMMWSCLPREGDDKVAINTKHTL